MAPGRRPGGRARSPLTFTGEHADDPQFMWRVASLLFALGGAIGAISLLLPHPDYFDDPGLWTNVAVTFGGAGVCYIAAPRVPAWPLHLMLLLGTIIVTRAVYLSDDPNSFYAIFYIWVGLYAALFFDWRFALAHIAVIAAAYAWILDELEAGAAAGEWATVIGTIAAATFVVGVLIRRLRQNLAESASLARERAGMMARFEQAANTDELTGLPNRRAWNHALVHEFEQARAEGSPLSVSLLDLDHFKAYNDIYGHPAGDRLLRELARRWRRRLRTGDHLARYGGEEFAVALPGCDLDDARRLVERLRAACSEDQTCSAGIAVWDGRESSDELLHRADQALYAAKSAGRDQVVAG